MAPKSADLDLDKVNNFPETSRSVPMFWNFY